MLLRTESWNPYSFWCRVTEIPKVNMLFPPKQRISREVTRSRITSRVFNFMSPYSHSFFDWWSPCVWDTFLMKNWICLPTEIIFSQFGERKWEIPSPKKFRNTKFLFFKQQKFNSSITIAGIRLYFSHRINQYSHVTFSNGIDFINWNINWMCNALVSTIIRWSLRTKTAKAWALSLE